MLRKTVAVFELLLILAFKMRLWHGVVLWFGPEMSSKGACVTGLVPSRWGYWEVVRLLGGAAL